MSALAQTEKSFQQAVLDLARLQGWKCFHPFDSRRSTAGWPDLALTRDGVLVLAELKTDAGRLTREQLEWGQALRRVAEVAPNVHYCVWRPSAWDEVERVLSRTRR